MLLTSLLLTGLYGCGRMHDNEADLNINPLDTIPIQVTLSDFGQGYYQRVRADGSVAALVHDCNGKAHGINLFFYENDFLRVHCEYEHGVPGVEISYNDDGTPGYCFPEMASLLILDGLDSIPASIQTRLDFIDSNCVSLAKINWRAVLVNECE